MQCVLDGTSPETCDVGDMPAVTPITLAPGATEDKCVSEPAPLVPDGPVPVVGGSDTATPLMHAGEDCWSGCSATQGPCDWCGSGLCCRKGWSDTSNGCDGTLGIEGQGHVCVARPEPACASGYEQMSGDT